MIIQYTSAYFSSNNPVLGFEVIAIESDTKKVKYGDGLTAYNSLSYSGLKQINNHLVVDPTGGSGGVGLSELTLVSGAIDGVNTIFIWSNPPLLLFWGGQLLRSGVGYILSGSTTTLTTPPFTGDDLWAYENATGGTTFNLLTIISGVVDGVNDTFVFSDNVLQAFIEGQLKVDTVGCNITGNTVVFTVGNIPQVGDNVTGFGNT